MKIKASDKYILLTEIATAILNQSNGLLATYPTAITVSATDPDGNPIEVNPVEKFFEPLREAVKSATESLSKGLYRTNCVSVLEEDIEKVYSSLQGVQTGIRDFDTEPWFDKYLVNLVCSVGAYIPILSKGLENLRCQH